jgi:hypothetical protein
MTVIAIQCQQERNFSIFKTQDKANRTFLSPLYTKHIQIVHCLYLLPGRLFSSLGVFFRNICFSLDNTQEEEILHNACQDAQLL